MIYFDVPFFSKTHKEQLHAMCAAPPSFSEKKDTFSYLPVDSIYTTGNGLPSFIVKQASRDGRLLTIANDSDVIYTQWGLATLINDYVKTHKQKWLNHLISNPLPIMQHCLFDRFTIYPIAGLNGLYLTLLAEQCGITDNIWSINNNNKPPVYLSSYIHKLDYHPALKETKICAHPFIFTKPEDVYQQHIYAGIEIYPFNKNYRTFCERLPFKPLGMQYTPSSWVSVLINKFSHFKPLKMATTTASSHPDLFAALVVNSVGLPANLLLDYTNFCSLIDMSKYELCEILVKISPLVDYCSSLMTDDTQINNSFSYFVDQHNSDLSLEKS